MLYNSSVALERMPRYRKPVRRSVIVKDKRDGRGGRREGAGRKPTGLPRMVTKSVTLPYGVVQQLEQLGDGNLSAGIRKAVELAMPLAQEGTEHAVD